jgi:signal transduction histidine kinase
MVDIREILKKAIESEATSYQEYLDAAQEATDPEAKSLLKQLAQDEARHRQVLETQLALLLEAKGISPPQGIPEKAGASRDLEEESCEVELEGAKRATSVLAEAKREIEKAQHAKDELYAMVTHDLRSPLISMVAFAKKLLTSLENKVSEKEYQKLQWIWSEARRMEGFVTNFLDLARLTSDKVVLDFQPLEPRLMVDEALEPLRPQIQDKRLHVEVTMGGLPGMEADAWAVKRLFMNLLANAVLHGRDGGTIEVGGEEEDGMIRFWVKDDGPGIREQDLPYIFEQFHTSAAGRKGSGLGLAIARQVVQAHGGRIWVESTEGKGATFYFTLPKAQEKKWGNSSPA